VKPLKLEFGDLKVGAMKTKHFKISNTQSNSTLTGSVAMPTGPNAAQFMIAGSMTHFSLTKGGPGDTITVQYTPSAAGATDTTMIVITSSDPTQPMVTVNLIGRGKKK
jgi:hypothetical protein